jgi:hypothetical protein
MCQQASRGEEPYDPYDSALNIPTGHGREKEKRREKKKQPLRRPVIPEGGALDVERKRPFGTIVDALAALDTGHAGLSFVERFFRHGKGGADGDAFPAFHAEVLVHTDLKGAYLVREGLKGPKRAEKPALNPPLCEKGQYYDKTREKRQEYDHLYKSRQ